MDSEAERSGFSVASWVVALLVAALVAGIVGYREGSNRRSGTEFGAEAVALTPTDVEIGFLRDMTDHHGQAVLMSSSVLRHGENEQVRQLALNILADQANERGQMAAFLSDRDALPGSPDRLTMEWMGMEGVPVDQMMGFVSQDELAELSNLRGTELDRRYLELMIAHHEGGVAMASAARDLLDDSRIEELAAGMVGKQQREITDMQLLLGP